MLLQVSYYQTVRRKSKYDYLSSKEVEVNFLKSLMLAILASILLTYVLGSSFLSLFDMNVVVDGNLIEPLQAMSVSALAVVILVVVALAIALSIFGSILLATIMILGCAAMVAIGIFWPVLLVAVIIWLISSDKQNNSHQTS